MTQSPSSDLSQSGEEAEVARVALGYFEGWFAGDAARVERALHPELVKRALEIDAAGGEALDTDTARSLVDATAKGIGRTRGQGDRRIEVEVEDVYGGIANVTVRSTVYREYLHLVRMGEGWKIVNALWQWT
jgi:Putative lumazine-binding